MVIIELLHSTVYLSWSNVAEHLYETKTISSERYFCEGS